MLSWLRRRNLSPASEATAPSSKDASTEWTWHVNSPAAALSSSVTVTHCSGARVDIPLAALVSGDMRLLPVDYYTSDVDGTDKNSEDQEAMSHIQQSLNGIAARCSSPFGSFPVGQILHAVAPR
jgi:hypothetical protein